MSFKTILSELTPATKDQFHNKGFTFSYNYNKFPEVYPSTQIGKETAIEQSRIFWASTPDFIRASDPFPKTREGLAAQNEFYRDFWKSVGRQPVFG